LAVQPPRMLPLLVLLLLLLALRRQLWLLNHSRSMV
jgi:hypothetical protein